MDNLGTIILNNQDMEDRLTYIYVNEIPLKFGTSSNNNYAYYFAFDDDNIFIVYMSISDYKKLNKDDIIKNPVKIMGVTCKADNLVKEIAIDVYNNYILNNDSGNISMDDYDSLFGSVYLDATKTYNNEILLPFGLEIIFFIIGGLSFLFNLILYVRFKKSINKLSDDDIRGIR